MQFTINGRSHDIDCDVRTSLPDLLRDRLGLTGTKKGCDQGACGACTVLVDGERINSCLALAVQYQTRSIVTIEGIAAARFTAEVPFFGDLARDFPASNDFFDERSGRFMNPSLAEYHVPVHLDVPEIEIIWNDIPDPRAPLGLHGTGEIGITGAAAAIANAVYNATGRRIRDLPITLDKVLTTQKM
jgi:hypothetical protein